MEQQPSNEKEPQKKYITKIIILVVIFCIIEFLRLGYMRKDQAQQMDDLERFDQIEAQIVDLEYRISKLES